MASQRCRALVPVLLLFGLLGVAHVERALARVGVLWRQSAVSWDNPATQLLEEVASQAVPHADAARQARERVVTAHRVWGRLRLAGQPAVVSTAALGACITRAPPVA